MDAFILSVNDEFFSEYPPEHFKRLAWLTGFDGSAGTVIILANEAAFFTDGRYTLQAQQQLDADDYTLINSGETSPLEWLKKNHPTLKLGIDPWLISTAQFKKWQKALPDTTWQWLAPNPVDALWEDRPALSALPAFDYPLQYAGKSREAKLAEISAAITAKNADSALITVPESLAWLLNMRGRDVAHTPVMLCRALVHSDATYELFADSAKTPAPLSASSRTIEAACANLQGKRILIDPTQTPLILSTLLEDSGGILMESDDPCTLPKACKNNVEADNIRNTHIVDGVALTQFLHWLSTQKTLSEISAADQLETFRKQSPDFLEPSFPSISGFGDHGAIVHYRATPESDRNFEGNTLYLIDSGGQYWGGTTDVTRTLAWGTPTAKMREHYTLVLKGHIALAQTVFPKGTAGRQLDALARQFLWQAGLDYDHGTGHGVGCCLGVHEGPQGISKSGRDAALQTGMVLSNEPGYYLTGEYGIRIENLVIVRESARAGFLEFETLTCAPFDRNLVEKSLLTPTEIDWWNRYHAWIEAMLTRLLPTKCHAWLQKVCASL